MIWVLVAVEDGPYLIPLLEGILRLFDLLEFGGGFLGDGHWHAGMNWRHPD